MSSSTDDSIRNPERPVQIESSNGLNSKTELFIILGGFAVIIGVLLPFEEVVVGNIGDYLPSSANIPGSVATPGDSYPGYRYVSGLVSIVLIGTLMFSTWTNNWSWKMSLVGIIVSVVSFGGFIVERIENTSVIRTGMTSAVTVYELPDGTIAPFEVIEDGIGLDIWTLGLGVIFIVSLVSLFVYR